MSEVDFLIGRVVEELRIRNGIRVVFDSGESVCPTLYASIGTCLYFDAAGKPHEVVGKDVWTFAPVLDIVGKEIKGVATDGGTLVLNFTDGSSLSCPPDDRYEAWEVAGGSPQNLVVCTPGGELAVWDDQSPRWRLGDPDLPVPPWVNDIIGRPSEP
jgi:hypothetical protein